MVSGLLFKSLIHFELFFVCGVSVVQFPSFYMWLSGFPSTIYWAYFINKGLVAQRFRNMSKLTYILSEEPELGPGV